ncbi:unnamed protein product [Durusdinium trenchii]|uniref:Uncharacterized protein n=1 Tax=Durusdinium trenchii TaxID=1381693 RepID=A0ABP0JFH5_9DINO
MTTAEALPSLLAQSTASPWSSRILQYATCCRKRRGRKNLKKPVGSVRSCLLEKGLPSVWLLQGRLRGFCEDLAPIMHLTSRLHAFATVGPIRLPALYPALSFLQEIMAKGSPKWFEEALKSTEVLCLVIYRGKW